MSSSRIPIYVFADAVIAQDDIGKRTGFVGHQEADDPGAIIGDGRFGLVVFVGQDIERGGLAVDGIEECGRGRYFGDKRIYICGGIWRRRGLIVTTGCEEDSGQAEGKEKEFVHIAKIK